MFADVSTPSRNLRSRNGGQSSILPQKTSGRRTGQTLVSIFIVVVVCAWSFLLLSIDSENNQSLVLSRYDFLRYYTLVVVWWVCVCVPITLYLYRSAFGPWVLRTTVCKDQRFCGSPNLRAGRPRKVMQGFLDGLQCMLRIPVHRHQLHDYGTTDAQTLAIFFIQFTKVIIC